MITFPWKAEIAASATFLDLKDTNPYPADLLGLSWKITSAETTSQPSDMKNSLRSLALASNDRFAMNRLKVANGFGWTGGKGFFFFIFA